MTEKEFKALKLGKKYSWSPDKGVVRNYSKTKSHARYQSKDGTRLQGVTTIINAQSGWNKQVLMAWARREAMAGQDPTAIADVAKDIGTLVHYMIECHIDSKIKGFKINYDSSHFSVNAADKADTAFIAFLEWEERQKIQYNAIELKLISEKMMFGGTMDLAAVINGKNCLVDFKTSKGIYSDYKIQMAAYGAAFMEMWPDSKFDEYHIIKIGKEDGAFQDYIIPPAQVEAGLVCFKHHLETAKLQKILDN